jgi:hypothetical protein
MRERATMNSATLETESLRIVFERCGDRFGHEIQCRDADGFAVLLRTLEGQPEDPWPPGPPLQSLHLEAGSNGNQTAMLVGMAGTSHWSMTVEADRGKDRFLFDIACRIRELPQWLGSSYNHAAEPSISKRQIELLADSPLELSSESDRTVLRIIPQLLELPATVRWQYAAIACSRDDW